MRIVIKIGTSTLAYSTGRMNIRRTEALCRAMCDLKNAGHEIILISSGAIGMGVGKLGLKCRPSDMPTKQAAAAVGQGELMYTYDKLMGEYNHTVAQILLTAEDIEDERRCENFRNTLFRLLELGAIPVVNENDTVATDEIVIGDNDTLAAVVAADIRADLLVLLSGHRRAVYRRSAQGSVRPPARRSAGADGRNSRLRRGKGLGIGHGGMRTKLHAAKIAMDAGST